VPRSPDDRLLDRQFSSHVNADAIDEGHELSSFQSRNVGLTFRSKSVAAL
jgi:hypothetical protein